MSEMKNTEAVTVSQPNYSAEIIAAMREGLTPKKMQEKVLSYHEKDIAEALPQLTDEERTRLFRILDADSLADIFQYIDDPAPCLRELGIRKKAEVLSRMEPSVAAEILQGLSREEREALVELMDPDARSEIVMLNSFDDDEIGSKMSTNYVAIHDTCTVKLAMSELIRQAADNDNITTLYVIDKNGTFCGAIDLKDLIIAREGTSLSDITTFSYPYVYAKSSVEACMPQLTDYYEDSIPVLDNDNKLIGVVTAHDLIGVMEDELNEDYAKLAGLTAEEDLGEPIRRSVRKRLPWLGILLLMGLGVSATVGLFESIVAQLPVIMCFQSLILDMAGNVGTQSLAVAIRVLVDGQLTGRQKAFLVFKEARVGIFNGLIMGILSFAAIGGYLCLTGNAPAFAFAVSGCLGLAMLSAMFISSLSGTVIPLFFRRIGIDPAVASGPLITTVNDLVAVISYYGLAWLILINLLHLA